MLAYSVDPELLVQAVLVDQVEMLANASGLAVELCERCIGQLRQKQLQELLAMEEVPIRDKPSIRFAVAPDVEKPLNELSVGQKGTVIISLALVEGEAPIVIDQPEDSLDTVFIYEEIVRKLRAGKEKRQFIFATHNPNVLVSADADLSFVLAATADKGTIRASGGIDQTDTNRLLLLHLEGGEEAFRLRSQKYRLQTR